MQGQLSLRRIWLLVVLLHSQLDLLEEQLAEEEVGYLITKGRRVMGLSQLHRFLVPIERWDTSACTLSCIVANLANQRVNAPSVLEFLIKSLDF